MTSQTHATQDVEARRQSLVTGPPEAGFDIVLSMTPLPRKRVWPRGASKEGLGHEDRIRDVAPSNDLRERLDHEGKKWGEFRKRYCREFDENEEAVRRCLDWCGKGPVTLHFGARDREPNQAVVLWDYLVERLEDTS